MTTRRNRTTYSPKWCLEWQELTIDNRRVLHSHQNQDQRDVVVSWILSLSVCHLHCIIVVRSPHGASVPLIPIIDFGRSKYILSNRPSSSWKIPQLLLLFLFRTFYIALLHVCVTYFGKPKTRISYLSIDSLHSERYRSYVIPFPFPILILIVSRMCNNLFNICFRRLYYSFI